MPTAIIELAKSRTTAAVHWGRSLEHLQKESTDEVGFFLAAIIQDQWTGYPTGIASALTPGWRHFR
jgi:hypothetical protein